MSRLLLAALIAALAAGCDEGAAPGGDAPEADGAKPPVDTGLDDAMADAFEGTPDAMPGDPDAMPGDPDAMPGDPDAMPDEPDAMPDELDAIIGEPDAMPDEPDAIADATPIEPDAGPPAPLFDLALIGDADDADCRFENPRQALRGLTLLDVWDVSYRSYEVIDGALSPIRIRAFAARPAGMRGIPGVVMAHGLGGYAEQSTAEGPAALIGAFVIAYTGPGGGNVPGNTSEGRGAGFDNGYRLFDVLDDPRGSWFWGHGVAAMRGLTCLENHPDVDPERLGMTGYSAGGVATLMVAGVDPRVIAAVPLSATGAWDLAVRSPTAWQHGLLTQAGLDVNSPEWAALLQNLDVAELARQARGKLLMVNGSTDEFFPLDAHLDTFEGLPGEGHRTSISGNYDHGCYAISGGEPAGAIEERAIIRAEGGQRMWFAHHFGTDDTYATVPATPIARIEQVGPVSLAVAQVDRPAPLRVRSVKYWWSDDSALLFAAVDLEDQGGGVWSGPIVAPGAGTVWYVDVEYQTQDVIAPERFSLSTPPHIPDGFAARIRRNENCLPP